MENVKKCSRKNLSEQNGAAGKAHQLVFSLYRIDRFGVVISIFYFVASRGLATFFVDKVNVV